MSDLETSITTIQQPQNFQVYDTAADGGEADGLISQADLKAVADGDQFTPEQRAAAQYFVDNPDKFKALDAGQHHDGLDGLVSSGDLEAAAADAPLFEKTSAFASTKPLVGANGGNGDQGTPAGAAAQLAKLRETVDQNSGTPGSRTSSTGFFANVVAEHKDDPQWLHQFFQSIGTEQTAAYLSNVSDPNRYAGIGEAQATEVTGDVRTALHNAYAAGAINDADIGRIVESWAKAGGDPDTGLPQLFAGIEGPKAQDLKNAFSRAAMELSATGQQQDNPQFTFGAGASSWLSAGDRTQLAAAASHVLSGTSPENQIRQLELMRAETSPAAFNQFIAQAMAGPASVDGINALTPEAIQRGQGQVGYGGITDLLVSVSNSGSPELQSAMFSAVSRGLSDPAAFANFRGDATFKEALSNLFINNSDQLLHSYAPDGAFSDPAVTGGMTKFFELALFTQDPGANREQLMEHVLTTMADVGNASVAPPLSQQAYESAHGGWSQQDHVEVMGGLQGMVLKAAQNQKGSLESEILADREQRQQMIGFMTGLAFAFVPGGGTALAGLSQSGGNWLSKVPATIAEFTYDQSTSQLESASQKQLLKLLSGAGTNEQALSDVDQFLSTFKQTIQSTSAALPNGEEGELNLRTAFQSAFSFYGHLVSF